jgi:hypothetical protein
LAGLSGTAAGLALLGGCQLIDSPTATQPRMRRIGYVYPGSRTAHQPSAAAFLDRLRQLGWLEGENLTIEWRFGEGRNELVVLFVVMYDCHDPVLELVMSATARPLACSARQ